MQDFNFGCKGQLLSGTARGGVYRLCSTYCGVNYKYNIMIPDFPVRIRNNTNSSVANPAIQSRYANFFVFIDGENNL